MLCFEFLLIDKTFYLALFTHWLATFHVILIEIQNISRYLCLWVLESKTYSLEKG